MSDASASRHQGIQFSSTRRPPCPAQLAGTRSLGARQSGAMISAQQDRVIPLAAGSAAVDWLTVYQLPPYASELNPVETVWWNPKRSLANLTEHNIDQLTALVRTRLRRMQYRARPPRRLPGQYQARPE